MRATRATVSEHALHQAVEDGDTEEVEALLQGGVSADTTLDSTPALLLAAQHGQVSSLKTLLKHEADVSILNKEGWTALHVAAASAATAASAVIEELVAAGANSHSKTLEGMTPLMLALNSNHKPAVELLLRDAQMSECDNLSRTPLHLAVACCPSKLVERLLVLGYDANAADEAGRTPLHYSAVRGIKATAQLLLKAGADANLEDSEGVTALQLASVQGSTKVAELLGQYCDSAHSEPAELSDRGGHASEQRSPSQEGAFSVQRQSPVPAYQQSTAAETTGKYMQEVKSLQSRLQDLEGAAEQNAGLITVLQHDKEAQLKANIAIQQEYAQSQVQMQAQAEAHAAELETLNGKLQSAQEGRKAADRYISELKISISEAQMLLEGNTAILSELQGVIRDKQNAMDAQMRDQGKAQALATAQHQQQLDEGMREGQMQLENIKQEKEALVRDHEQMQQGAKEHAAGQAAQLASMQAAAQSHVSLLKEMEATVQQKTAQVAELQLSSTEYQAAIAASNEEHIQLKAVISSMETQSEANVNKLQAFTSQLQALTDSNATLQSQLDEGTHAVSKLLQSASQREYSHAEAIQAQEEEVQKLQKQVEAVTRSLEEARVHAAAQAERVATLELTLQPQAARIRAAEDAYARLVAKATRSTKNRLASDLQQAMAAALDAVSQALSSTLAPVIPASPLQDDPASTAGPDFIPLPEHDFQSDVANSATEASQPDGSMPDHTPQVASSGAVSAKSPQAEQPPDDAAEGTESEATAMLKPAQDESRPTAIPSETAKGPRAIVANSADTPESAVTPSKVNAVITNTADSTGCQESAAVDPVADQQYPSGDADAFEIATPTSTRLLACKSVGSRAKGTPVRKGRRSILGNISNLLKGSS